MSWAMFDAYSRQEDSKRNPNYKALNNLVREIPQNYYQEITKPVIFDRAKCWTTPANMKIIRTISSTPKIIFTIRNPLEILSSFIVQYRKNLYLEKIMEESEYHPYYYLPLEDAKCDFLMDSKMDLQKGFYSISHALSPEVRPFVHFVGYNDLVTNPKQTLINVYKFLGEEYYEHNFFNIDKQNISRPNTSII